MTITLTDDIFDTFKDEKSGENKPIKRFTWKNTTNKSSLQVITYGATITTLLVPDKNGKLDDIVFGFDNLDGYRSPLNAYFGATIGRVANRIGSSKITINGTRYVVTSNSGKHQLHGGYQGFDKVIWDHTVNGNTVTMTYNSKDMEEGYPGNVRVSVTFELTEHNEVVIDFKATTDKPTVVNLTNHSYFNLAGHTKCAEEMYRHIFTINADKITEVDIEAIPTGKLTPVEGTVFDLRTPKLLKDIINKTPSYPGFDHNFCINGWSQNKKSFVARVEHPNTGRIMEVYSNQPGVQFYTSNFIPEDPKKFLGDPKTLESLKGKGGQGYYKHGAFCLETQNYPDAINHENFPNSVLNPKETYHHIVSYKFSVTN